MMRLPSFVPLNSVRQKSWHRFRAFVGSLSICSLVVLTSVSGIVYAARPPEISVKAPKGTRSILVSGANGKTIYCEQLGTTANGTYWVNLSISGGKAGDTVGWDPRDDDNCEGSSLPGGSFIRL